MPLEAIVPRLAFRSSSSMPMPLSLMVSVLASLSNLISIAGSNEKPLSFSSVRLRYFSLSMASDALLISSRRNISLLEYREWMMRFSRSLTSVLNCFFPISYPYVDYPFVISNRQR